MNNLLTTVSGYFSRSLILGAFLPTVIAVAVFALIVLPQIPEKSSLIVSLAALETEWKVISASFATIIFSGLINNLNTPLIRVYEGYPWRRTKLGKWKTKRQRVDYDKLIARQRGMRATLLAMDRAGDREKAAIQESLSLYLTTASSGINENYSEVSETAKTDAEKWKALYSAVLGRWTALSRQTINNYPHIESLILPTRLGNVIRSFEVYPLREYGMDSIALYTRLISKMEKDFAVIIDEAKTSFDFMINCSALAVLLLITLVFSGLYYGLIFGSGYALAAFLLKISVLTLVSYLAYLGAVNQAADWGQTVKSGFDLYRNDLLKQLGFSSVPANKREERVMWEKISRQMIDGDSLKGPRIDYAPSQTVYPLTIPDGIKFSVLRGLDKSFNNQKVVLMITNSGADEKAAENVAIVDKIPGGWFCVPGTIKLFNVTGNVAEQLNVTGTNPYRFEIGSFEKNEKKKITFEIKKLR